MVLRFIALALLASTLGCPPSHQSATSDESSGRSELLLTNGRIFTADGSSSWAEAVGVSPSLPSEESQTTAPTRAAAMSSLIAVRPIGRAMFGT